MAKTEKIEPEKKQFSEEKKNKLARIRVSEWGSNYSREKIKYGTFSPGFYEKSTRLAGIRLNASRIQKHPKKASRKKNQKKTYSLHHFK